MKHSQFKIGKKFWMSGKQYLCTDIGKRTIVALEWEVGKMIPMTSVHYEGKKRIEKKIQRLRTKKDYRGPPYILHEIVIAEWDFDACQASKTKFQVELIAWRKKQTKKNKL